MNLGEIKEFLKIDGNDDDALLTSFQKSAEEYLLNAGVVCDYTKELYKLAVKMLIGTWYENKDLNSERDLSICSLKNIIVQLR